MKNAMTFLLCLSCLSSAWAHGGASHEGEGVAVSANAPQRLPDGKVYLPKDAQRQMGVLTQVSELKAMPRGVQLSGRVVMDPNAGGKVQAMQTGRISAGAHGLPVVGQVVKKGELLAYVIPAVSGQAGGGRSVAQNRLERMRQLTDIVPRKALEEAEAAVANEQSLAPVSGVIASANVVLGQVVEARETLFEIVDPQRMMIEAVSFDPALANNVAAAYTRIGNSSVPLQFVGSAHALREQALPLIFRAKGAVLQQLVLGQVLNVVVQTRSEVQGMPLPARALAKSATNQDIVWVKVGAETFAPRTVIFAPLDGTDISVTSGLSAGERVVVDGVGLLNQVR